MSRCVISGCRELGEHQEGCSSDRCRGCRPRYVKAGFVCPSDRTGLESTLDDIRDMWPQLTSGPSSGIRSAGGAPVSGSKEPRVPANLDKLDLRSLRLLYLTPQGWKHASDQVGYEPVVGVLCAWVRDWRETLFPAEGLPAPALPVLVRWLSDRLDRACSEHPGIGEFAGDIADARHALRRVLGLTNAPPEKCMGVRCRACDRINTLYREGGLIQCKWCGHNYSQREYESWVGLLNADARQRLRDGEIETPVTPPAKRRDPGAPRRSLVAFPDWVETR